MWTPSDRFRLPALLIPLFLLVLPALDRPLQAQGTHGTAATGASSENARRELRDTLRRRYQASSVHNGVLLKPRAERLGVHEVEVSGDSVVVNGARVSPDVLRSWIGDADAAPLLRLLEMPPADRQTLMEVTRDVAVASGDVAGSAAKPANSANRPLGTGSAARHGDGDDDEEERAASSGAVPPVPPATVSPLAPLSPMSSDVQESAGVPAAPDAPLPPPAPAAPAPVVNAGSRVRFAGPVTVGKNEVAEEVMTVGGSVHIEGEVSRDVSAVGGSVRVNGRVGGNVSAVGGSVHLGPHSEVMGDVAAIGGTVVREPGSVVHGNLSDVGRVLPGRGHGGDDDWDDGWLLLAPFGHSLRLAWTLSFLLLLLLAVSLVVLLAPNGVEQVRLRIAGEPWTALAAGILGEILVGPTLLVLMVLLIVSIVGCLLLVLMPFLVIALMLAALVGFVGVGNQVGRLLEERFNLRLGGPYVTTILGVLAIQAPTLIGHLLSIGGSFLHVFAWMFMLCGMIIRYLAWTIGFGAAILTAFSNRPQRFRRRPPLGPSAPLPPAAPVAPAPTYYAPVAPAPVSSSVPLVPLVPVVHPAPAAAPPVVVTPPAEPPADPQAEG